MVIMHKGVAFRNTVKRLSSCICVRDSDPWGGAVAPFYEVGRERSEPGDP